MLNPRYYARFRCAGCQRSPMDGTDVYRVTVERIWKCWTCLTAEERERCIR